MHETSIKNRVITEDIFNEVKKIDKYYAERWDYHNEIIQEITKLENVENILEIGPRRCPLVKNEDVIDYR